MKLPTFFILTHSVAGVAMAASAVGVVQAVHPWQMVAAVAAGMLVCGAASWRAARRVNVGLTALQRVVADHEYGQTIRIGLQEFDRSLRTIGNCAARWETAAAATRRQTRELQAMMKMLDCGRTTGEPTSSQLRGFLAELGESLYRDVAQREHSTAKIQHHAQAAAEAAEMQRHSVIEAASGAEQLASTIDSQSSNATSACAAAQRNGQSVHAALALVRELVAGMKSTQLETSSCETNRSGPCDLSQRITATAESIGDLAARIHLMALNASIEAIRAPQRDHRYSLATDEMQKLSQQTSATVGELRELLGNAQWDNPTGSGGAGQNGEQGKLALRRALAVQQALERLCDAADQDIRQIREIASTATSQLRLVQTVRSAIQNTSKIADTGRRRCIQLHTGLKTLSKTTPSILSQIQRMRDCGTTINSAAGAAVPVPRDVYSPRSPEPLEHALQQ